jgi:hypothetical protein
MATRGWALRRGAGAASIKGAAAARRRALRGFFARPAERKERLDGARALAELGRETGARC